MREYPARPVLAASAVVLKDGLVLLTLRANEPGRGYWSFPGGVVNLGETAEGAAIREVWEETGIEVRVMRLLGVYDRIEKDEMGRIRFHYFIVNYLAEPLSDGCCALSDSQDVRWLAPEELRSLPVMPSVMDVLRGLGPQWKGDEE